MRASELFLRALHSQGVEHIFGIVGREAEAILFDEFRDVQFHLTRHEFSAGVMADVFARLTGRMQACFSTFGPGITNLSTGVASSMLDRSPMLAIGAQIEQPDIAYNQCHQCIDNVALMKPITKYTAEFPEAAAIPRMVAEATVAATTEMFGPSFLSFPVDVMKGQVPDAAAHAELAKHKGAKGKSLPTPDHAALSEVHRLLSKAQRPVAIVGNSVMREGAAAELKAFVDKYGVAVVSTLASKGALPDDHPYAVGPINRYLDGILKAPLMKRVFGEMDLLLLLGYDLSEDLKPVHWRQGAKPPTTVMVSQVPNPVPQLVPADLSVVGSVKKALSTLAGPEFKATARAAPPEVGEFIRTLKAQSGEIYFQHYPTLPPQLVVKAARRALGPEGILVSDIGLHKQYAGLFSETSLPNTFVCSNGLGAFGFGVAGAMGAQLAFPDRRVLAICGDGGFLSNSQDLETMVRLELPIVMVIFKDGAFGLIKHYQLRGTDRIHPPTVDFLNTDFVKLAESHGCRGLTVNSTMRLDRTLQTALDAREPIVVQIPVSYQYRF